MKRNANSVVRQVMDRVVHIVLQQNIDTVMALNVVGVAQALSDLVAHTALRQNTNTNACLLRWLQNFVMLSPHNSSNRLSGLVVPLPPAQL